MIRAISMSHRMESSYAFLMSPFLRFENVTCRFVLFSILFISSLTRPILISLSPLSIYAEKKEKKKKEKRKRHAMLNFFGENKQFLESKNNALRIPNAWTWTFKGKGCWERERDGYKWAREEIGERDWRWLKKEKVTTWLFLMVDRVYIYNSLYAITVGISLLASSSPTRRSRTFG